MSALDADWQRAQVALATPFFNAIRAPLNALNALNALNTLNTLSAPNAPDSLSPAHWPTLTDLNRLAAAQSLRNDRGVPIRFIAADGDGSAMSYETRIAERGEIPTRENFHDLFNALQWLAIPRTKATISALHADYLLARGDAEAKSRSVARDVLTMFDESGVIVLSTDASLLEEIRQFEWKRLFVHRRAEVLRSMRFILVGHGLLEKSLTPFIGMTAKAVLLRAPLDADADELVSAWLRDPANLRTSRCLSPLPLLGIPGWDARNASPLFYDDTSYFRPGYSRDQKNRVR